MDVPRRVDDVLSQPTRARIFRAMGDLRRPVGTEELATELGLHPNGVRMHLDRLLGAGLVERDRMRQPRGRPRDMWAIAPDARPGGDPPTAYGDLGRWLARVVAPSRTSLRTVERTGRDIGRELAPTTGTAPDEEKLHAALSALGFAPHRAVTEGPKLTYELCNCPFREAVLESRETICTLHRGITQGLLDGVSPETRLAGFVPKDPISAGCLIELTGPLAAEAATAGDAPPA
jgi:predicted ArsR family transcriptional regulator